MSRKTSMLSSSVSQFALVKVATLASAILGGTLANVPADEITVSSGQNLNGTISLSNGDILTVEEGASVSGVGPGNPAIQDALNGTTATIVNNGTLSSAGGAGIEFSPASTANVINNASGLIQSNSDALRPGNFSIIDNKGRIIGGDIGVLATGTLNNLTNSGFIEGQSSHGVAADDLIDSLTNSGTIRGGSTGVLSSGPLNNLTNSGLIEGIAASSNGITSDEDIGSLTNSGTIRGDFAGVLSSMSINSLTNSGLIEGISSRGVSADNNINLLTNSGTIRGTFSGILSGGNINKIVNTGTIEGDALGVRADGTLRNLENNGTIAGFVGVEVARGGGLTGDVTITNSGTITSTSPGGTAIRLALTGADTINLNAGSVINGEILFDGVDDVINFGRGLNAEISLPNLPSLNFGSGLGTVAGNVAIQVDPSAFAAVGDTAANVSDALSNSIHNRLGNSTPSSSKTAWVSAWGVGNRLDESDNAAATSNFNAGTTVGLDWFYSGDDLLGIYGSIGKGQISVNVKNGQQIDNETFIGGIYGRKNINDLFFDFNLAGGIVHFESERKVTTIDGLKTARASYNGVLVAPDIKISKEVGAFRPSVGFGYRGLFVDSFTETGTNFNVSADGRAIHEVKATAQVEFNKDYTFSGGEIMNFRPYLGLEGSVGFGDANKGSVTIANQNLNFDTGQDNASLKGFAGANFSLALTDSMQVFGNTELSYATNDDLNGTFSLGFSKSF